MRASIVHILLWGAFAVPTVSAQQDPLKELNQKILETSRKMFSLTFEERTRWEEKFGVNFGKSVNQQDMMSRIRIGGQFEPTEWLRFSAMGQDARGPFYGNGAPNTIRDTMDLQEAYVELFRKRKSGFGALFGREMLTLGEGRLIGSPQWTNVTRTFDTGRVYYQLRGARMEALMVSPVRVLPDDFNKPELGERIWGTYDTLPRVWKGASIEVYALRHSQNKIGGWTGLGTLGTNTFGGRFYGPLPDKFAYSLEAAGQTGHMGLLRQRAFAWYSAVSKETTAFDWPLRAFVEYKEASGTQTGSTSSGTFDQLRPSNHDKFGHEDLFGWRNLRTLRNLETLNVTKSVALSLMYSNEWLASASDSLYNSQGTSISVSKAGTAGKHVGQELDGFVTYERAGHLFGAGVGHFFKGEFINNTTPNINPRYFYVFQQYSFK